MDNKKAFDPVNRPKALDEMTQEEFDEKMARGLAQAVAGEGMPADDFFDVLKKELSEQKS